VLPVSAVNSPKFFPELCVSVSFSKIPAVNERPDKRGIIHTRESGYPGPLIGENNLDSRVRGNDVREESVLESHFQSLSASVSA